MGPPRTQPVQDGVLEIWDSSSLPDGTYTVRVEPGSDALGSITAKVSWNDMAPRPTGATHGLRSLVHLQPVVGVVLSLFDFGVGQLVGPDRVAASELGRRGVVGDRLNLEDVEPAEFGNLLERQRTIVDQPRGGRMRHQGLGHCRCLRLQK